jgi:hypothetical protein
MPGSGGTVVRPFSGSTLKYGRGWKWLALAATLPLAGSALYAPGAYAAGLARGPASPGVSSSSSAAPVRQDPIWRHALSGAVRSAPPSAVTITFSEFPVSTVVTTQYAINDGIVFQGDSAGDNQFIATDDANPDSPELSGTPQFTGNVGARFVLPGTNQAATVDSVTMDVGYIDNPGSTEVSAYDSSGTLLGSVVAEQLGWNNLTIAFKGIASFTVSAVSGEDAGFGLDNVTFVPPSQIAVSSVDIKVTGHAKDTKTLPADVIDDRVGADALTIDQFTACGATSDAQWVDCSPDFPDGTPEKSWPVAFQRGTKVTLNEVHLKIKDLVSGSLDGSTITGTATVGQVTLTFTSGPVNPTGNEFVVKNVTSDNALPNLVNSFQMKIDWTVKHDASTIRAGSSTIPIYLAFGAPGFPAYLTLEALTSAAAANQTTEGDVFHSIWTGVFSALGPSALAIHPRHLDSASGAVTADPHVLQYWTPWDLANDYLFLDPMLSCSHLDTPGLLEYLISRCGDWAQFFANTLAVQGITTVRPEAVDDGGPVLGPFPAFPKPAPSRRPRIAELMLIKNWVWPGPATGRDPNFPYLTADTVSLTKNGRPIPGTGTLGAFQQFNDAPGAPGQNDTNPPGWFAYGDHAIDVYNNMVYDPSYGLGPFSNIASWAKSALAGFAYITYTDRRNAVGKPIRTYTLSGHMGLP